MKGSQSPTNQQTHSSSSRFFVVLVLLPLSLAAIAFALQWRGGVYDPVSRLHVDDLHQFSGLERRRTSSKVSASSDSCAQVLGQSSTPAFPYFRLWTFDHNHDDDQLIPKICITSSTSAGLEQILPWIYFHKVIGVGTFFLFVEGKAASPHVSSVLESIAGVKVIRRTPELEEKQAQSRIWNETWLRPFLYKPCNHELFVKQTLNMEIAIEMAQDLRMDWIVHLDTDELIHPAGASEYSLRTLFSDVPKEVDTVVFSNHESCIEQDDLTDPFTQVTLFKKNYDHLSTDMYFGLYREVSRGNPNYFLTYGNGKSAARVQDHLRPNGAHRWYNYMKKPNETKLPEAVVLHYTYCKFSDLTSRRNRCNCKPTREDVKRCFMLEFDRAAYIIASTASEEEMLQWYKEHVVWNDQKLKLKLLTKGVFIRIHTPMAIIQALKESGVFQAAISSASKALKKNSFPSEKQKMKNSIFSNKSNKKESVAQLLPHVEGNKTDSREPLDIDEGSQEAIPPLSPPWQLE